MRSGTLFLVVILVLSGLSLTIGIAGPVASDAGRVVLSSSIDTFDLTDFGAVGDGIADDGPALQSALDAIAAAGGGTLLVPAGRYAIITPVLKVFSGTAVSLEILGIPSSTSVNPDGNGLELTAGLDLTSEFVIKTGPQTTALTLQGLETLLISDMVFIGTPGAVNDARVTLFLYRIADATIRHSEFYGLSTINATGAIVHSDNSRLTVDRTVFLGSTGNSGLRSPVILVTAWKGVSITQSIFADYGQRPNYYGKLGLAPPFAWVMIGNTAATTNLSPRREVTIRNVFLDEGGLFGISAIPDYYDPQSTASDLIYISDLRMNVSSLNAAGVYLHRVKRALIERAQFGLSRAANSAVSLVKVNEATLDRLECLAAANRISADVNTGKLTVINSIYTHLNSQAQITQVITTNTEDEDPVQHVRQKYVDLLDHEPDAAAHDYWSNKMLLCGSNQVCVSEKRLDLLNYVATSPNPFFALTGKILKQNGVGFSGVSVSLTGSQNVSALTDAAGRYRFEGLPTSGVYTITPARVNYTFNLPTWTITTPNGDRVANFTGLLNNYSIAGQVLNSGGQPLSGATVTLSGSRSATAITGPIGNYSFTVPAEGNYTVSTAKEHYVFAPASTSFTNLSGNRTANFTGTLKQHAIAGQITKEDGSALAGVAITLSGTQTGSALTVTDGRFSFTVPAGGNYSLAPAKTHYTFAPTSTSFSNLSSNQTVNFIGTLNQHAIAGQVANSNGSALSGVTISLSGSHTGSVTTGADGRFSFAVPAGGNYVLSSAKTHYTFAPTSTSLTNLSSNQTANFTGTLNQHAIAGQIANSNGSTLGGAAISLSGSQTTTVMTGPDGRFSITVPAGGNYTVTPSKANYLFAPVNTSFDNLSSNKVADFAATLIRTLEFSAATYQIVEGQTSLVVTLVRKGDVSGHATATYSTRDELGAGNCNVPDTEQASSGCDYITSVGSVSFAPGETSKTFSIPIVDDGYAEGSEDFELTLSNLDGVDMGLHGTASVTISDNETVDGANPIESAGSFVRQQYIDFFNREPDPEGLAFWTSQITSCGSDAPCLSLKRTNTSGAFFLSTEFRETGYLVYRMYKASYGNLPGLPVPVRFEDFLPDTQQVGRGVVVGRAGWAELLENNKLAYIADFVERSTFTDALPTSLTPMQFVDALFANAGVTPSPTERTAAINEFGTSNTTEDTTARARSLRLVAENQTFAQQEFNRAFVLIQYFGYLRRNPNDAPEATLDFQGYNFWLGKLNQFDGNFVNAQMVEAFITSGEYRQRFGP